MSEPSPSGKRILCIDGGGFRGLGCLLAIEAITDAAYELCREPGTPALRPCEIFDLIYGSSTGGLLAVLLGRLGLDCTTAIQEYKTLAQKLFPDDRNAFMDVITTTQAELPVAAYEDALADLVLRHGGGSENYYLPNEDPGKHTETAVMTKIKGGFGPPFIYSSKPAHRNWLIREIARQATAATIYLSPFEVTNKALKKPDLYIDAAYEERINPSLLAISEAKKLWELENLGAVVSIGQWFSEIAPPNLKVDRIPSERDAKPFIPELLSNYTAKLDNDKKALFVVQDILEQAVKTVDVNAKVSKSSKDDGYFRLDPPLGIPKWELVDRYCPDLEANVRKWLASPEGKDQVDKIAAKLVKPLPGKRVEKPKPKDPTEIIPPRAANGTHKPHPKCEEPRPKTMIEYLQNYHVIFVIDDSTSMIYYGDRWDEARNALRPIADYAVEYKADSIDMCFLNSPLICQDGQTSALMETFDQARPPPLPQIQETYTGACLRRILDNAIGTLDANIDNPTAYQRIKPFDIVLLTDGDPTDEPKPVIEDAWRRLRANKHHPNYIGIQIVQIGNDATATEKLKDLMNGNIGNIVDTVPYNGVVTTEKLQRILLGALQPNGRTLLS